MFLFYHQSFSKLSCIDWTGHSTQSETVPRMLFLNIFQPLLPEMSRINIVMHILSISCSIQNCPTLVEQIEQFSQELFREIVIESERHKQQQQQQHALLSSPCSLITIENKCHLSTLLKILNFQKVFECQNWHEKHIKCQEACSVTEKCTTDGHKWVANLSQLHEAPIQQ